MLTQTKLVIGYVALVREAVVGLPFRHCLGYLSVDVFVHSAFFPIRYVVWEFFQSFRVVHPIGLKLDGSD